MLKFPHWIEKCPMWHMKEHKDFCVRSNCPIRQKPTCNCSQNLWAVDLHVSTSMCPSCPSLVKMGALAGDNVGVGDWEGMSNNSIQILYIVTWVKEFWETIAVGLVCIMLKVLPAYRAFNRQFLVGNLPSLSKPYSFPMGLNNSWSPLESISTRNGWYKAKMGYLLNPEGIFNSQTASDSQLVTHGKSQLLECQY